MSTASPRSRATVWVVAVVALAVLGVAAIAYATTRDSSEDVATGPNDTSLPATAQSSAGSTATGPAATGSGPTVTAPVTVQGTALEGLPTKGADPAVGKAFPELSGSSVLDGSPQLISNDGKAKLILFVAHWCPHCQREVPVVQKWLDSTKPAGIALYAVSTGVEQSRGNYPPADWLAKEKWTVPTLADSAKSEAAAAAGLTGYPFFVAVDAGGKVVARASGELTVERLNQLVAQTSGK